MHRSELPESKSSEPKSSETGKANALKVVHADTTAPRMRILFADDEPSLQKLMQSELSRMGYAVAVCPDGLTAIAALEKSEFDCLLVDLDMPGRTEWK